MKKIAQIFLSLAFVFCVGGFFAAQTTANAETPKLVSELFIPSNVCVETIKTDSALAFEESGVQISSHNIGDKLAFRNAFSGDLTLDYAPDKDGSEFSFRNLSITITETNSGEMIEINVEHGENFNVSVSAHGQEMGIFYPSYGVCGGLTQVCNDEDKYTQINTNRLVLTFNPETMSVYAGEKGVDGILVWSFFDQTNDGKNVGFTLDSFAEYTVNFELGGFLNDSGVMLLYEVNGCKLDTLILNDSAKPVIFVPFTRDMIVGEEYTLPAPVGFDLYYGKISSIDYEIFAPNGTLVGKNLKSFTPDVATTLNTNYKVIYEITKPNGITASKEYILKSYSEKPNYQISLDWNNEGVYPVGSSVYVPKATARGGVLRSGSQIATVTVKKNDLPIRAYTDKESGFYFTLNNVGEYVFSYNVGSSTLDFSILAENADNAIVADGLSSSYRKGEFVDASKMKVKVDGEFVDFDFIVQYPDGAKYSNKKFIAEQIGEYVISANATVDGQEYSFEKTIAVYGKAADFFTSSFKGFSSEYATSKFTGRSGVKVTVTQSGSIIDYTQEIDLNEYRNQTANSKPDGSGYTILSNTAKPIIDMSLEPASYGVQAVSKFYIYITDALDPTNKITIVGEPKGNSWWTYIRANAPLQKNVGFYNGGTTVVLNNAMGRLDESYGFMTAHSFKGSLITSGSYKYTTADSKIELFYDADEKQLLTHPQGGSANRNHIIMDFDDPLYCGGITWQGFSSDKVKISLSLLGISGSGSAVIYSIGGREFSQETLNYDVAPEITLDLAEGKKIEGMAGRKIAIPKATAIDKFGEKIDKIITKVYYDYNGSRLDVDVKDGKFTTLRAGTYYIVYMVSDAFGNTAEKIVPVTVKTQDVSDVRLTINQVAPDRTEAKTLDTVIIGADEINVENAVGEVEYSIKLYYIDGEDKREIEILYGNPSGGESYMYFVPEESGIYHVEYTVTDSVLRTCSDYYEITVTDPQDPVIIGALPSYLGFIRGNYYDVATVKYIDYALGSEIQEASMYVNGVLYTDKTIVFEYCENDDNCDKVHMEEVGAEEVIETVVIEYRAGERVLESYNVPIKNTKKYTSRTLPNGSIRKEIKLFYDRYFVVENGMTVTQSTGADPYLQLVTENGMGKAHFAQPLSSSNPSLVVDVDFAKNSDFRAQDTSLKGFYVTFTDALDKSKAITIYVYNEENINVAEDSENRHSNVMKVNGVKSIPFTGSLVGTSASAISISYRNDTKAFYDAQTSSKLLNVNYYDDGRKFEGFSPFVYMSIKLDSWQEQASLRMYGISGHAISNTDSQDSVKPIISVDGSVSGVYSVGEKVTVFSATASDVLSYIVEGSLVVTVTVKTGSGEKIVSDVNGLLLDKVDASKVYEIVLSEMGNYSFTYNVNDSAGNVGELQLGISAISRIKPTITLSEAVPTTVEFGKEFNIPVATVSFMENNPQNITYALIIAPDGSFNIVEDNKFNASEAGIYTLRYYALDAYGNFELLEYDILCK